MRYNRIYRNTLMDLNQLLGRLRLLGLAGTVPASIADLWIVNKIVSTNCVRKEKGLPVGAPEAFYFVILRSVVGSDGGKPIRPQG